MTDQAFPAVIGVGASAGGVEALAQFVGALPGDFGAPVLVVLHISPTGTSLLADILDRRSPLRVVTAADGDPLVRGHVFVAPPDKHLRLHDGVLTLDRQPRVNGHRPAIDPLFGSLADAYGARGVGVVLSGTRDDGTLGLAAVKAAGGQAFVQDPDEALYGSMPASAMRAVDVDGCLPVVRLAERLIEVANGDLSRVNGGSGAAAEIDREPTRLTCPDCGGVIFREDVGGVERYACSIGHAYGPDSFIEEHARHLESALWAAVRSLDDRADLLRHMSHRAEQAGRDRSAARYRADADEALRRAESIRAVIAQATPLVSDVINHKGG